VVAGVVVVVAAAAAFAFSAFFSARAAFFAAFTESAAEVCALRAVNKIVTANKVDSTFFINYFFEVLR
jgi:hypothetical protein